jgi:hypothetical protein
MRGTLADMAFDLGLFQFAAFFSRGRGTLLMLHEIHSDGTLARYDGTTIAELDRMLAALRRWDIDLIAMDDLLPRLKSDNPSMTAIATILQTPCRCWSAIRRPHSSMCRPKP